MKKNNPISIFIDGNAFALQKLGGISRYWVELLKYYIENSSVRIVLLRLYKGFEKNVYLKDFLENYRHNPRLIVSISNLPPYDNSKYRSRIHRLKRNIELLKTVMVNRIFSFDVYHSTYYTVPGMVCRARRYFITVYDMIHEEYLSKIKGRKSAKDVMMLKRRALEKCNGVICISNATRKKLFSYYPELNADYVSFIYLGINGVFKDYLQYTPEVKMKFGLEFPYFLYVGNRSLYKNFDILFKSFEAFLKVYPDTRLLLVGGERGLSDKYKKHLGKNKQLAERIILLRDVSDSELAVLYHLSVSFISTSLAEGFGIPVLEAMASNASIILSDINVYREIAGGCAVYFNPKSTEDLLQKMTRVYADGECPQGKYSNHLTEFTWEKCAAATLEHYMDKPLDLPRSILYNKRMKNILKLGKKTVKPQIIYHCCIQKTASVWFNKVFSDNMIYEVTKMKAFKPGKNFVSQIPTEYLERNQFEPKSIISPLYIKYEFFDKMPKPVHFKAFFVMRDPRDFLVSWYFSTKYSHTTKDNPSIAKRRAVLNELNDTEALTYIIDQKLGTSQFNAMLDWMEHAKNNGNVLICRYEDIFGEDQEEVFSRLLAFLDVNIGKEDIQLLLKQYRFDRFAKGRKIGEEDIKSHYRKGISGDWKNYFNDQHKAAFKQAFGDLLIKLGYEKDDQW